MIRLKDITSGYRGTEIIKNIDISFEKGSITSIIGKNGCGKTTLIKTASGLLKPFSGDIMLDGCIFRTHTDTVFENIRTVISELSGH